MALLDNFESIVTTIKRNCRYYGPTESKKIASTLSEVAADLKVLYSEVNTMKAAYSALASGYLLPSGYTNSLYDLGRDLYGYENRLEKIIDIKATQASVL